MSLIIPLQPQYQNELIQQQPAPVNLKRKQPEQGQNQVKRPRNQLLSNRISNISKAMWKDFKQSVRECKHIADHLIPYSIIGASALKTGPIAGPCLTAATILICAYKWEGILKEQKKNKENESLIKEQAAQLEKLKDELLKVKQELEIVNKTEVYLH